MLRLLCLQATFLLLCFPLGLVADAAQSSSAIALVTAAKGSFKIIGADGSTRVGSLGSSLKVGDRVETDRNATVMIVFLDESTMALAGDTDLTINEYSYGEGVEPKSVTTVESGTFRFVAGKMAKMAPENYKVKTETATIGIRGSGGEVVTSDGSKGRDAGLLVATIPGHVLEVTTHSGVLYVVDDPAVGLSVNSQGIGTILLIEGSLFAQYSAQGTRRGLRSGVPGAEQQSRNSAPQGGQGASQPTNVCWYPFRESRWELEKKRRSSKDTSPEGSHDGGDEAQVLDSEDLENNQELVMKNERERSSSVPMMQRLGEEMKADGFKELHKKAEAQEEQTAKNKDLKMRDIHQLDQRESSVAGNALNRMSQELKKEHDIERSKMVESQQEDDDLGLGV